MTTLPPNYIGDFLKENESNLLKIERENPELYKVVGDLLTYLNKNYGDGKSVEVEAQENVQEVVEKIQSIENQEFKRVKLVSAEVVWNEGGVDVKGFYPNWTTLNQAFKQVHEDWVDSGSSGYSKVKIRLNYDDALVLEERIDVGNREDGDFDPNKETLGYYLISTGYVIAPVSDTHQFEDYEGNQEAVNQAVEKTKDEIEAEILALEETLKFVEEESEKERLNEEIEALRISLNLL